MNTNHTDQGLTVLTVHLLIAYLARNSVRVDEVAGLIGSTHAALADLAAHEQVPERQAEVYRPAVSPKKSLANRNFIVSLIDGKSYKSLKRHLRGNGITPEEYRARYKLPDNYPMVAPAYSDTRSEVAKRGRLGRLPRALELAPRHKLEQQPGAASSDIQP